MSPAPDAYRVVGPVYDRLATLFSGAAIHQARTHMLDVAGPQTHVLFAGVGHGTDAVCARQRGARVTVVDRSATMLARLRENLAAAGITDGVDVVHEDVRTWRCAKPFDIVVANFFLNVFADDEARRVLRHLLDQARPGATIIVGDFHPPSGAAPLRLLQHAHWWAADLFFGAVARNAIHGLVDVVALLREAGVDLTDQQAFRVGGAPLYIAVRGRLP